MLLYFIAIHDGGFIYVNYKEPLFGNFTYTGSYLFLFFCQTLKVAYQFIAVGLTPDKLCQTFFLKKKPHFTLL